MRALVPTVLTIACAVLVACSGDDTGGTASNTGGSGTGANGGGAGDSGAGASGGSGGGINFDGGGDAKPDACVADKLQATLTKEPVDIIVAVDTSATMNPASSAVEQNINTKFASVLAAGKLDYRVIAIAGYGSGAELCVEPPLGGASCASPPATPANTTQFFHYPRATGSGDLLKNIVTWYTQPDSLGTAPNGWSAFVRAQARKVFLVFSDTSSGSSWTSTQFDTQLLAQTPAVFGTAAARNYVFHSIIGLKENSPATAAWQPGDPVVSGTCTGYSGSLGAGQPVQEVSILSGGLRFPICQFAAFDVVFQKLADDVVKATPLACEFPIPAAPAGKTIDPNTIQLTYTPGSGVPAVLKQVKTQAECDANSFYVVGSTIFLCPAVCDVVKVDTAATMDFAYGCDVGFVK